MAKTVESVARQLVARFPKDSIENFDETWSTAERAGVDPDAVLMRMQDLYFEAQERAGVTERWLNSDGLRVMDLRGIESRRTRIKASSMCLMYDERDRYGSTEYVLVREPDNKYDNQAVAIYGKKGRCVGYVSASIAARLSSALDQLPAEAFLVSGTGTASGSSRMWVDLPRAPEMRKFVSQVVRG